MQYELGDLLLENNPGMYNAKLNLFTDNLFFCKYITIHSLISNILLICVIKKLSVLNRSILSLIVNLFIIIQALVCLVFVWLILT